MSIIFTPAQLSSLETTAATAAAYLDACDSGARHVRLDPQHYKACGDLLLRICNLTNARQSFPGLLEQSAAAREAAESIEIARHLAISRLGFYPELAALMSRVTA